MLATGAPDRPRVPTAARNGGRERVARRSAAARRRAACPRGPEIELPASRRSAARAARRPDVRGGTQRRRRGRGGRGGRAARRAREAARGAGQRRREGRAPHGRAAGRARGRGRRQSVVHGGGRSSLPGRWLHAGRRWRRWRRQCVRGARLGLEGARRAGGHRRQGRLGFASLRREMARRGPDPPARFPDGRLNPRAPARRLVSARDRGRRAADPYLPLE